VFSGGELEIIPTENDHVLGFIRRYMGKRSLIFANFAEIPQSISSRICEQYSICTKNVIHGISKMTSCDEIILEPLDFLVFG
jgi:hypothetical protein